MYLYLRQARLVDGDGALDWAKAVRSGLEEASGQPVRLWQNAYSPAADQVSWACWFGDLGVLEDSLQPVRQRGGLPDGRDLVQAGSVDERVFAVAHGDPDPQSSDRYMRSLRALGAAGHLDRGLQAGVELARKSEEVTGVPTIFLRSVTGTMGTVAWLTTYPSLTDFQAGNEKLLNGSNWLWYRDRQAEATKSDSVSMALHRRLDD